MKMNIKGLVFVGFAAAIFASAANAAGEAKTVTSQAYVDGKFQTLANLTQFGEADEGTNVLGTGTGTDAKYPSEKAVANAIAAAQTAQTYDSDGTTITKTGNTFSANTTAGIGSNNKNLVTGGQVQTALDDKVTKNADITGATKTKITYDAKGLVTAGADLTASDLPAVGATNGSDEGKILTVDANGKIAVGTTTASGSYQPKSATNNYQVGNSGGTWDTMAAGTYTTLERDTTTDPDNPLVKYDVKATTGFTNVNGSTPTTQADNNKLPTASAVKTYVDDKIGTNVGGQSQTVYVSNGVITVGTTLGTAAGADVSENGVADAETGLVSGDQVHDYVATTLGNLPIPAEMPAACKTSGAHCALVTTGTGTSMTAEWTVMAQPAQ